MKHNMKHNRISNTIAGRSFRNTSCVLRCLQELWEGYIITLAAYIGSNTSCSGRVGTSAMTHWLCSDVGEGDLASQTCTFCRNTAYTCIRPCAARDSPSTSAGRLCCTKDILPKRVAPPDPDCASHVAVTEPLRRIKVSASFARALVRLASLSARANAVTNQCRSVLSNCGAGSKQDAAHRIEVAARVPTVRSGRHTTLTRPTRVLLSQTTWNGVCSDY